MSKNEPSLYDYLNTSPAATADELKIKFHALSKVLHPDKSGGDSEAFRKLNHSYRILSDSTLREFYDKYGYEAVQVAEDIDHSDLKLAVPSDKLKILEEKVRNLIRTSDELRAQQLLGLQGNCSAGVRVLSLTNPFYFRWQQTALNQSVSVNISANDSMTIASTALIQRSGGGVGRLSCFFSRAGLGRLGLHWMGEGGLSFDGEISRPIDKWNLFKQSVNVTQNGEIHAESKWEHSFGNGLGGAIGVSVGSESSVGFELLKRNEGFLKKLRGRIRVELSESDASISFKSKMKISDKLEYSFGPSVKISQGVSVDVACQQIVEPPILALQGGSFPTILSWGWSMGSHFMTLSARFSRGGLGFTIPIEVPLEGDDRGVIILGGLAIWASMPALVYGIEKMVKMTAHAENTNPDVQVKTAFIAADCEQIKRLAHEVKQRELAVSGLIVLSAKFDDYDVTDLLMARVVHSSLQISSAPREFIFGDQAKNKTLAVTYKNGSFQTQRCFQVGQPIILP